MKTGRMKDPKERFRPATTGLKLGLEWSLDTSAAFLCELLKFAILTIIQYRVDQHDR